jgi:hypothetical protein
MECKKILIIKKDIISSLTVNIPDDLDKELNNLKVKKEEFLLNTLKEKINLYKSDNLQSALAEGYKNNYKENKKLENEFLQADLESWYDY